jgi:sulfatase modifying factor 1
MKIKLLYFIACLIFLVFNAQLFSQTIPNGMVLIPAAEFNMGMNSDNGTDFSPVHKAKLDSFLIDVHEVTNAEYAVFCNATGYKLPEFWGVKEFRSGSDFPNYPVVGINWYDACKYAEWAGKRLSTEAEWEYAARGGLVDNDFPTGNELTIQLRRNTPGMPWENLIVEVASFDSNGYGLYDMAGNVWEWVSDKYEHGYYQNSPVENPKGAEKGYIMSIRGGSWHSGKMCNKVYFRRGLPSNWVDFSVGFRCAKDF